VYFLLDYIDIVDIMAESTPTKDSSTPVKVHSIPIEITMSPIVKSSVGMQEKVASRMETLLDDMKQQV